MTFSFFNTIDNFSKDTKVLLLFQQKVAFFLVN